MFLRNKAAPIPLRETDNMQAFEQWVDQPLFLGQPSKVAVCALKRQGVWSDIITKPLMSTDSNFDKTNNHLSTLFKLASISRTPGFHLRRLNQGGAAAALHNGLLHELVAQRMGHNSGETHVRNYTAMMTDLVLAMMTMAGHYDSHLQLRRTAVSARDERFNRLYDVVNRVPDSAGDRLQLWRAN